MTTKTTHTPGPWFDNGRHSVRDTYGECIAQVLHAPDARLIAMAPRMAELTHAIADYQHQAWAENAEQQRAAFAEEARAILRVLDTPDAPYASRGKENGK